MITVAFPTVVTAAADEATGGRTVAGVAVPWDVVGIVSDGSRVRFRPGSLDAGARPVVLRDHDRARPIGRVVAAHDSGAELEATARVSRTRDGDEALVLASDGVLGMFSVGANPTEWVYGDDGVLEVLAAEWQELSLLTIGAFTDARVMDVAAAVYRPEPVEPAEPEEPEPEEPEQVPQEPPKPDDDDDDQEEPAVTMTLETIAASAPTVLPLAAGSPPDPPLTLSRLSSLIAGGAPAPAIMAALTDIKTTDLTGVVRPAVLDTIRGLVEYGRPVINAINRQPLPPSGMTVEWPKWADLPNIGQQATQKTAITTGTVVVDTGSTNVITFAGANDVSLQAVQRSNPSFIEAYLRGAAEVFARTTEAYAITTLLAAAAAVTPAATFLDSVEAMVAAFDPLTVPNGRLFLAMSWDVGATLIGVTQNNGPAFWSGTVSLANLPEETSGAGLNMFVSRQLPAKTMLMGVEQGATWYEDPANPQEIRVVDVELLGLNIGVYGFAALSVEVTGAFKKVTFTTLPTMAATSSKK